MHKISMQLGSTLLCLVATGCCGSQKYVQAIDYRAISAVEAEIKRQIGVYMLAADRPPIIIDAKGDPVTLSSNPNDYYCGSGKISFDILSVKADLTTTLDRSASAQASFAIPTNAVVWEPSGTYKYDQTKTQELV